MEPVPSRGKRIPTSAAASSSSEATFASPATSCATAQRRRSGRSGRRACRRWRPPAPRRTARARGSHPSRRATPPASALIATPCMRWCGVSRRTSSGVALPIRRASSKPTHAQRVASPSRRSRRRGRGRRSRSRDRTAAAPSPPPPRTAGRGRHVEAHAIHAYERSSGSPQALREPLASRADFVLDGPPCARGYQRSLTGPALPGSASSRAWSIHPPRRLGPGGSSTCPSGSGLERELAVHARARRLRRRSSSARCIASRRPRRRT